MEEEEIFEELMAKNFKFDDNYKPRDPRIPMNPKHKKHKENYLKTHNNQIAQNQS